MIGLGWMGVNIVCCLVKGGYDCVVYDYDFDVVKVMVGEDWIIGVVLLCELF